MANFSSLRVLRSESIMNGSQTCTLDLVEGPRETFDFMIHEIVYIN